MSTEEKIIPKISKRGGARPGTGGRMPGAGRKKGVPNRVTTEFREVITRLLEDNSGNFGVWLSQVAADDPGKALDLVSKLAEFAAPKLARTELTGDKENPVSLAFTWKK